MVEKISPPMTAIPMGLQISDPDPVLNASGIIPRMVVREVINTGRSLDFPETTMASFSFSPRSRIRLM